ncbi:hypothetical protein LSAT2_007481 [Lamellibrachia satsuma]|nr:hypothetical protein LSAT2_007481 [Lamellibrachia satsuma]
MALYGLGDPHTPLEIHIEWQERVAREKRSWREHMSTVGVPGNPMFPGWRDVTKEYTGQQNYYNNKTPKGEHRNMYDRLFHIDYGYDPKRKRCDRNADVGLDINAEEESRVVHVKGNTEYGRRIDQLINLEPPGYIPHYGHYNIIEKEIYKKSNLGVPIKVDDNEVVIHTQSGLQTKNSW